MLCNEPKFGERNVREVEESEDIEFSSDVSVVESGCSLNFIVCDQKYKIFAEKIKV